MIAHTYWPPSDANIEQNMHMNITGIRTNIKPPKKLYMNGTFHGQISFRYHGIDGDGED